MKKTIALLTDFGLQDTFVGVMKGVIASIHSDVQFVDISHNISPQNVTQGALMLKSAYPYFPKGTIFLCVVDPGVGSSRKPLLVESENYTFIAPDNGLLTAVLNAEAVKIYEITNDDFFLKPVSNTFHGRDIFSPVTALLAKGLKPLRFGRPLKSAQKIKFPKVTFNAKNTQVAGEVIYIDHFGNLITNIEQRHITKLKGKHKIQIGNKIFSKINQSYSETKPGQALAIVNSMAYLEIAVNQGSAIKKLKAKIGTAVKLSSLRPPEAKKQRPRR